MKIRRALPVVCFFFMATACHAATTLTLGHIMARDHPQAKACESFAKTVKTLSKGRIQIEVHGDARLGDSRTMLRALQNGSLELSVNTQGPVAAIVPEFSAFSMPFLFPDAASAWRVLDGPVGQQLVQNSAARGIIVLGLWDSGIRHFSNSVRPLLKPTDLAGLRIRTSPDDPVPVDIVESLGGKPQEINWSGLYDALRLEVVDGQENPLVNFQSARLYEVQKFISLTAHKYTITPFLMGKPAWDALSVSDRQIILTAAREATRYQRELNQQAELEAYRDLVARGLRIDKVDVKPFIAATAKIYDKWYASPIGDYVRAVVQAAREQP